MTFELNRRAALALALAAALACCGGDEPSVGGGAEAAPTYVEVTTRDGVLRASFPTTLVMHAHARSVFATSYDGARRLYLTHEPAEKLIRLTGATKDGLAVRGWTVSEEKHLERATYLGATRKSPTGAPYARTIWLVDRDTRVVSCEAVEPGPLNGPAAELAMSLCKGVIVIDEPAPPAEDAPPAR
jgi:hypothetical protein